MDKVKVTFTGTEWNHGMDYSENCGMCQNNAGLANMLPIPTIAVRLELGKESKEAMLCMGCIQRGLASQQIEITNPIPEGCPFSMEPVVQTQPITK